MLPRMVGIKLKLLKTLVLNLCQSEKYYPTMLGNRKRKNKVSIFQRKNKVFPASLKKKKDFS